MKPVVCIYCEGSDTKVALVSKEKDGIKVHKAASLNLASTLQTAASKAEMLVDLESESINDDISFDSLDSPSSGKMVDTSDVGYLSNSLSGVNLGKADFIPVITEPSISYHIYEGPKDPSRSKNLSAIIKDIQESKGITVEPNSVDYTELNDNTLLSVFIEGEIPCVHLVNVLASYHKRRYLRIPTIKAAELSLAYYVAKSTKFFPEDFSLIIYIGKEYSKLIFLEGKKLKHIGTTLDIGTKNLHTYDVYFSKILLEMENGGIPKLDNIILCGEDRSENLILSFYGTFPEANVTELKFDNVNSSELDADTNANLALYAIPVSAAVEYFDEQDKETTGINFLPKYVQENQKFLQFGWHSFVLLGVLFVIAFFFTYKILTNQNQISDLNSEIQNLTELQKENQQLVEQITPLEKKISSFDNTQAILDSVVTGTEVWSKMLTRVTDFVERRRNFWITSLQGSGVDEIKITGYSLSRSVLTEFSDYNNSSLLKSVLYDPLREKSAFAFTLNFKLAEQDTVNNER